MSEAKNSKTGLFVGLAVTAAVAATLVVSYANAVALGNQQEKAIVARWTDNKQILGNYTTRVAEMAQIPGMQRDDLAVVMEKALQARYGESGSGAAMQWIRESYPGTLSPELYTNIQSTIEAGRLDFQKAQTQLIDQKRVYETDLGYMYKGFWLKIAGYPKINLADYNVVTSTSAETSFRNGVDDGVQFRK